MSAAGLLRPRVLRLAGGPCRAVRARRRPAPPRAGAGAVGRRRRLRHWSLAPGALRERRERRDRHRRRLRRPVAAQRSRPIGSWAPTSPRCRRSADGSTSRSRSRPAHYAPEPAARSIVAALTGFAPAVYFSAAIPHQGGGPGLNRQWPSYWARLFEEERFRCADVLRTRLWEHPEVDWWYAQNGLLFVHEDVSEPAPTGTPLPLVHPQLFVEVAAAAAAAAAPARRGRRVAASRAPQAAAAAVTSLSVCCLHRRRERGAPRGDPRALPTRRRRDRRRRRRPQRRLGEAARLGRGHRRHVSPRAARRPADCVALRALLGRLDPECRRRRGAVAAASRRGSRRRSTGATRPTRGSPGAGSFQVSRATSTRRRGATEFQLRLVLADDRFLGFSDEFHRPVVAHGPARYVTAPLWHLDTALNSFEARRAKAVVYEHERRGMRIGALSHNSGLYLPELSGDVASAPVPPEDAETIAAVLAAPEPPRSRRRVRAATREEVDAAWPGPPFAPSLYRARLDILTAGPMTAELQQTVDVRVRNDGDRIWRWGRAGRPEIRLAYRWDSSSATGLRTPLPCDVRPGDEVVVPVHVVAPPEPGRRTLAIDLVHEHVRWFGVEATAAVEVRPRRRVAVAGEPAAVERLLDALMLVPTIEPVVLEPDSTRTKRRGPRPDSRAALVSLRRRARGRSRVAPSDGSCARRGRSRAAAARRPARFRRAPVGLRPARRRGRRLAVGCAADTRALAARHDGRRRARRRRAGPPRRAAAAGRRGGRRRARRAPVAPRAHRRAGGGGRDRRAPDLTVAAGAPRPRQRTRLPDATTCASATSGRFGPAARSFTPFTHRQATPLSEYVLFPSTW